MKTTIQEIINQRFILAKVQNRYERILSFSTFQTWLKRPQAVCYYGSSPYAAIVRIKGLSDAAQSLKIPFFMIFHGQEELLEKLSQGYNQLILIVSNPERIPIILPRIAESDNKIVVYGGYYNEAPFPELLLDENTKKLLKDYSNKINLVITEFSAEGNRKIARGYLEEAGIPVMAFPWGVNLFTHTPIPNGSREKDLLYIGTYYEKAQKIEKWFTEIFRRFTKTVIGPDWSKSSFKGIADQVIPALEFDARAGDLYSSHLIALNLHHDFEADGYTCNERTFNSIACGGFPVSDRVSRIYEFFDDSEIVTASSPEEYLEKIRYYLKNPDKRSPFRINALRKVYGNHTYHHRLIDLLGFLFTGESLSPYCPVLTGQDSVSEIKPESLMPHHDEPVHFSPKAEPVKILYCFPEAANPNHYTYSNIRSTLLEQGFSIIDFDFQAALQSIGQAKMIEQLRNILSKEKPDIFWHGIVNDELTPDFLDEVRDNEDIISIVFFSDDDWRLYNHSLNWVRHYNFATTNDIDAVPIYAKHGYHNVFHMQYAANPHIYYPRNVSKRFEVTFVGQAYLGRPSLIRTLLKAGINVRVWGAGWENCLDLRSIAGPSLPTEKMIETFCGSKIVLGLAWCSVPSSKGSTIPQIKGRTFEYPACRAFQITLADERLSNYFIPDKEIASFKNEDDLIEKIKYYLIHEKEREEIAEAAFRRVNSEHTWAHRWQGFFTFLSDRGVPIEKKEGIPLLPHSGLESRNFKPIRQIQGKSKSQDPLVSIYTFVYNRERYIAPTIESVLNQTYKNIEMVILNDGSTDNTEKIIKRYLGDPRIKYFYQENIGRNLDRFDELNNRAIRFSSGEYICVIGADDVYFPSKIDRQVKDFEKFPELDISFCNARVIDDQGNLLPKQMRHPRSCQFTGMNLIRWLFTTNFIPHPSAMIKRKSFFENNLIETPFAGDYHFWLKTARRLHFKYIDEVLWCYRVHDEATTNTKNAHIVGKATNDVLKEFYEKNSIELFYPEINACRDRKKSTYSAHLDFGREMLRGQFYRLPFFAVQEYQKALAVDPEGFEALNNLAIAYLASGQFESAERVFTQLRPYAAEIEPIRHNLEVYANSTPEKINISDYLLLEESWEDSELKQKMYYYEHRSDVIPGSTLTIPEGGPMMTRKIGGEGVLEETLTEIMETTNRLVLEGRWKEAEKCLQELVANQPDLGIAHAALGSLLFGKGEFLRAIQSLEEAEKRIPRESTVQIQLSKAYREIGAQDKAIEHILAAVDLDPLNPEILYFFGFLAGEIGNVDAVRTALLKLQEVAPDHPGIGELAQLSPSIAQGREAEDHSPDLFPTPTESLEAPRVEEPPSDDPVEYLRLQKILETARLHHAKDENDKAIEHLIEGIKTFPEAPDIYYVLAEILMDSKRYPDALEALQAMPKGGIHTYKTFELSGYCFEGLGEDGPAESYADKALGLNPQSCPALRLKGILAAKRGELEKAEKIWNQIIDLDPTYGEVYSNLGILFWARGKEKEGLDYLEKGCILAPTASDSLLFYQNALGELGEFSRAEKVAKDLKERYPLNKKVAFFTVYCLLQQEKYKKDKEAMAIIEQAMVLFGIDDGILSAALQVRQKIGPLKIGSKNKTATLSVCLIVKNEERHLARCLGSLSPVANEIIVVDTGSTDRTKDIARAFGAKVYDFPWTGDFSAARNFSISKANGEWILSYDADEVLSSQDYPALILLLKNRDKTMVAYSMVTRNYSTGQPEGWTANDGRYPHEEAGTGWHPSTKVRLFLNDPRIRFEGHVHEMVEPSIIRAGLIRQLCPIPVHHYGKLDEEKTKAKFRDYYALGRKKLEETGDEPRTIRELAIQAAELGKFEEAVELWKRLIRIDKSKDYYIHALFNMGSCLYLLGDYREALAVSKECLALAPSLRENLVTYACSELCVGEVQNAVTALEEVLAKDPNYPLAFSAMTIAHLVNDHEGPKEEYLNRLRRVNAGAIRYLFNFAKDFIRAGRYHFACILLDLILSDSTAPPETQALLTDCLCKLGPNQQVDRRLTVRPEIP